ncbi:hypothetical protein L1887_16777 [Cichorium endivia]|nr:hypothetical protein L1887_16777 [Cichorium endivia]
MASHDFMFEADEVSEEDVELGSVYEIYHKNLPPRTPVQLRSIRVVMVSEKTDLNVAISFVHGEEELIKEQPDVNNGGYEDEEEEVDDEDDNLKRRLKRNLRKRKRVKQGSNQLWLVNKKPMNKCKKLGLIKDPTERWSKERYLAAELSLLEAMKEKKAMIGNPITRPALRVEARKRIGDTGLLDHLLKHVANKVAPGGDLRFRRSHNADGAMEYWLESADLLKIRKDAGVSDPFWTPPPGWKPGDSPIQDPIMAKELNYLKEEISTIKRELFLSKKQFEEEMANLRKEIIELISKNKEDQSKAIVVSEGVDASPKKSINFCNSLLPSESDVNDHSQLLSREECKKEMSVILKKVEVSHASN